MNSSAQAGARHQLKSIVAALVGVPLALLLTYLGIAAWSIHHAESQARQACKLYVKDMSADAYLAQLRQLGFQPAQHVDQHTGEHFIDTTFNTVTISRYVCVVAVHQDRLASAEIRFVD